MGRERATVPPLQAMVAFSSCLELQARDRALEHASRPRLARSFSLEARVLGNAQHARRAWDGVDAWSHHLSRFKFFCFNFELSMSSRAQMDLDPRDVTENVVLRCQEL